MPSTSKDEPTKFAPIRGEGSRGASAVSMHRWEQRMELERNTHTYQTTVTAGWISGGGR
jgi:hypothetical protein